MNDNFILDILGSLEQNKSRKQINSDIRQLEKTINMLRLTGTFAKGNTKRELNSYIKLLQSQLNHVKLTAKIDGKNVKRELDDILHGVKYKDIDVLNIDENKAKLKVRKVIADVRTYAERLPITVNIEYRKNKLNNDLTTYLNKNTKINESSILLKESERIRELIDAIGDKKSLTEATDAFRLFKSEVSATGFTSKSTADKIKSMLGHITKIGSAFGVASMAINNFVKSLQTLRSNDTILTEISKTSEMTKQQLKELGDEAFKTASRYGELSSNYLLAVQEMARSGYEDTSKELGKLSLLAQSAGDMTADSANNYLLATDAAYKYSGSVEKLNAALDGANYISNKNSATLTNIADATRVSASFAANAGVAIDELTAAEATMIAVTKRGGSEIGRAFRSIILNLQGVSGEFDGEIIDEEQLKKVEARCHSLGVELEYMKDGIATLRNPMEVLKDLADVYNSLPDDSAEKQGLISDLGGKFHANSLSSLLSRWDMYEKMLKEFSQGTGSALEEAEKTANSWEGRLATLQNSWDSFINTLTNKDAIMNGISFFDRMIKGVESFVDTFGTIPTVLTAINTSMIAMHKNYGLTKVWDRETGKIDLEGNIFGIDFSALKEQKKHFAEAEGAISIWNQKIKHGKNDLETFNYEVVKNNAQLKEYLATCSKDAPGSLSGYQQYLQSTGQATESLRLKTLLLNTALTMLGGIAVQLIVTGIQKAWDTLNVTVEEQTEKVNELTSSIETLQSEYDELSQKQDVTDAEKRRLEYLERRLELDERILKAEQAQLFDEKTGSKFTDLFDKNNLNTQYLEEMNHNNKDGYFNISRAHDGKISGIDDIHERIANLKDLQATVEEGTDKWRYYQTELDTLSNQETKYIDKLSESENQLTINLGKYADNIEYLQGQLDTGELTGDQADIANEELKRWQNLYDQTERMIAQIQKLNGTYDDTDERMARSLRSIYDDRGMTDRGAYDDPDYGYEKLLEYTSKLTPEQKELWMTTTDGIHNAQQAIDAFEEKLEGTGRQTVDAPITLSFDQAWADSFTSENEEVKKLGDSLLDLAEKGRLTIATFNEADSTGYFKNLGISADEAVSKINKLVDESKQLSSMSDQISAMAGALGTKQENGFVEADTLAGFDVEVRGLESWDRFQEVLGSTTSSYQECQEAANELAAEWVNSSGFLAQLTEQNKEYYETQLEAMGIENYEEVIESTLALKEAKEALAEIDLSSATEEEIQNLILEGEYSGLVTEQIWNLYNAKLSEQMTAIDSSSDCQQFLNLANDAGLTAEAIELLTQLMSIYNGLESGAYKGNRTIREEALAEADRIKKELQGLVNGEGEGLVVKPNLKLKPNGGGKKSGGSGSSKDLYKEQYEKELKDLNRMHELGLISEEEYWKERMDLNERYFGESSGMHQKYLEEYQDNEEEILKGIKDLWKDYYDDRKNDLKDLISYAEKLYDREIDSLEEDIEKIEEKRDAEKKYWQERIDAIGDDIDAMEDANDERERAIDLQEKQMAVQRAMHQRTILLYSENKGMHYVNDSKAEREAKNDLDDAEHDNKVADLKKQQKDLEKQLDAILETYDAQIESIERQIDSLKKMKSAWSEIVDNQELKELEERLRTVFGDGLRDKILSGNTDFINSVTAQYASASDMLRMIEDATLADIQNMVAQYGVLPENLAPMTGMISNITNALGNVDTSGFNANLDSAAQSSSNAAEKVQGVTTALNNLSNDVSNYQMPTLNTDNFTSAFTEEGGILTALNGFMERYSAICDGIPEIWNNSLAEAFGQGGGNGDPLAGGLANDTKYDSLFSPMLDALENCKTNIESKLKECLGTFTSFQTDLSGIIGVGGGNSEDSATPKSGTSGANAGKGKSSGGEKQSGSGGGSDTIVGAIQEGGKLIDEALNGESDSWSASFVTAQGSIHDSATSIVECIESMVETVVSACIKAIEAINMLARADENNPNNVTPSPYGKVGHNHGDAFANGTGLNGLPHNEKNALVSEYGQKEMAVFPNGKTKIYTEPTLGDFPKGTVIYNEKQTEKLLKNKEHATGNAHADGTDDSVWTTLADGSRIRPLQPGDDGYWMVEVGEKFIQKWKESGNEFISNAVFEGQRQFEKWTNEITNNSAISNIVNNNRNMQPVTVNQNVTLNCPNLTNNSGIEYVDKQLGHLSQRALQEAYKR